MQCVKCVVEVDALINNIMSNFNKFFMSIYGNKIANSRSSKTDDRVIYTSRDKYHN